MSVRVACGCGREYAVPPWSLGPRCLRLAVARSLAKQLPALPSRRQRISLEPSVALPEKRDPNPDPSKAVKQAIAEGRYDIEPCRSSIPVIIGPEPGFTEIDLFRAELAPSGHFVGYSEKKAAAFWKWLCKYGWISDND